MMQALENTPQQQQEQIPQKQTHSSLQPIISISTSIATSTATATTNPTSRIVPTTLPNSVQDDIQITLENYLLFTIIILDKLHNRSSLSLILIHLRHAIDNAMDINATDITEITTKFTYAMNILFTYSNLLGLSTLHQVYLKFTNEGLKGVELINALLCCSESLADFLYFNGIFDKDAVASHDLYKSHSHFQLACFKNKISSMVNINDVYDVEDFLNPQNLNIVQSATFSQFHIQRLQALGLFDKHVFKN